MTYSNGKFKLQAENLDFDAIRSDYYSNVREALGSAGSSMENEIKGAEICIGLPEFRSEESFKRLRRLEETRASVRRMQTSKEFLLRHQGDKFLDEKICSISVDQRNRVILHSGAKSKVIGTCDSRGFKMVAGNETMPSLVLETAKSAVGESIDDCQSPYGSTFGTSSPSTLFHNVACCELMKMVTNYKSCYEPTISGCSNPDIIFYDRESEEARVIVEMTTADYTRKRKTRSYQKYAEANGCIVLYINKYDIVEDNQEDTCLLRYWSQCSDSRDYSSLLGRLNMQSMGSGCKTYEEKEVLDFFVKGRDTLNRSISFHCICASGAFKKIVADEMNAAKHEHTDGGYLPHFAENIPRVNHLLQEIILRSRTEYSTMNKYFIYPRESGSTLIQEKIDCYEQDVLDEFTYKVDRDEDIICLEHEELSDIEGPASERKRLPKHISLISKARMNKETYESMLEYSDKKLMKDFSYSHIFVRLFGLYRHTSTVLYEVKRELERQNPTVSFHVEDMEICIKPKLFASRHKVQPQKSEKLTLEDNPYFFRMPQSVDKEHLRALTSGGTHRIKTVKFLSRSRIYSELRFRAQISRAILTIQRPSTPFRVSHYCREDVCAEVILIGLPFKEDSGFALVSYICDDQLIRTERWFYPQISCYSVGAHRLVSILSSMESEGMTEKSIMTLGHVASMLISEASWSNSKILKSYKYFAYNAMVKSPLTNKSLLKFIESCSKEKKIRPSIAFLCGKLIHHISAWTSLSSQDRTPALRLQPKFMCSEVMLMNMCPYETMGHKLHLKNAMKELKEEVDQELKNELNIREIYSSFRAILSNPSDLQHLYYCHFKLLMRKSSVMNNRFTYSPASSVLVYDMLPQGEMVRLLSKPLPGFDSILTARGSFDTFSSESCSLAESMMRLTNKTGHQTMLMNALKVLSKEGMIDMSMKMFDKSQLGGDREISVMSNQMNSLVKISEYTARRVNTLLSNEFLHKRSKVKTFIDCFSSTMDCAEKLFLSVDQTRWGPNFNTLTFCHNFLMIQGSTEPYLAAYITALSEMSIFESPKFNMENYKDVSSSFSITGYTARYHMGQGIHHASSSMYHSLVSLKLASVLSQLVDTAFRIPKLSSIFLEAHSFVTSDDASFMIGVHKCVKDGLMSDHLKKLNPGIEGRIDTVLSADVPLEKRIIHFIRKFFKTYSKIINIFGIKTSEYKNVNCSNYCEFNSIYLSDQGILRPTTKYAYSMISPITSGSLSDDIINTYNVYTQCINSLVHMKASQAITYMAICCIARIHGIQIHGMKFPTQLDLQKGVPPVSFKKSVDDAPGLEVRSARIKSYLKHKKRDIERLLNDPSLCKKNAEVLRMKLEHIHGTRLKGSKAMKPYFKAKKILSTKSASLYALFAAGRMTFSVYMSMMMKDPNILRAIVNPEFEYCSNIMSRERTLSTGKIDEKILRVCEGIDSSVQNMLAHYVGSVALYDACIRDHDQFNKHLLHSHKNKACNIKESLIEKLKRHVTLEDKYRFLSEVTEEDRGTSASSCALISYIPNRKEINSEGFTYLSYTVQSPIIEESRITSSEFKLWVNYKDCTDISWSEICSIKLISISDNRLEIFSKNKRTGFLPQSQISLQNISFPSIGIDKLNVIGTDLLLYELDRYLGEIPEFSHTAYVKMHISRQTFHQLKEKHECVANTQHEEEEMDFLDMLAEGMQNAATDVELQRFKTNMDHLAGDEGLDGMLGSDEEDEMDIDLLMGKKKNDEKDKISVGFKVNTKLILLDLFFFKRIILMYIMEFLIDSHVIFKCYDDHGGIKELFSGESQYYTIDTSLDVKVRDLSAFLSQNLRSSLGIKAIDHRKLTHVLRVQAEDHEEDPGITAEQICKFSGLIDIGIKPPDQIISNSEVRQEVIGLIMDTISVND